MHKIYTDEQLLEVNAIGESYRRRINSLIQLYKRSNESEVKKTILSMLSQEEEAIISNGFILTYDKYTSPDKRSNSPFKKISRLKYCIYDNTEGNSMPSERFFPNLSEPINDKFIYIPMPYLAEFARSTQEKALYINSPTAPGKVYPSNFDPININKYNIVRQDQFQESSLVGAIIKMTPSFMIIRAKSAYQSYTGYELYYYQFGINPDLDKVILSRYIFEDKKELKKVAIADDTASRRLNYIVGGMQMSREKFMNPNFNWRE